MPTPIGQPIRLDHREKVTVSILQQQYCSFNVILACELKNQRLTKSGNSQLFLGGASKLSGRRTVPAVLLRFSSVRLAAHYALKVENSACLSAVTCKSSL